MKDTADVVLLDMNIASAYRNRPWPARQSDPEGRMMHMTRLRVVLMQTRMHIDVVQNGNVRAEKTMTATDVTGFDAIFSTGFFATFSRFWGARLTKLRIDTGEKAKTPVESLQWRRRPEIADFCPLSWSNLS